MFNIILGIIICLIFDPCKVDQFVESIIKSTYIKAKKHDVGYFINNFSRNTIMNSFATDLLKIAKK